jgi:hypothetical protein
MARAKRRAAAKLLLHASKVGALDLDPTLKEALLAKLRGLDERAGAYARK